MKCSSIITSTSEAEIINSENLSNVKGNLNNINNSDEEVSKKNDEGIQKTKVNRVPTKPRIRIRPDVEIQKSFEENFQIQKHGLDQLVFKPYEKI